MPTFGDRLRQARQERQITLTRVSEATKISERYLAALEAADLDSLPGPVFNRGYVRTYATFLGLDAEAVVRSFADHERQCSAGAADVQDVVQEMSRVLGRRQGNRPSVARLALPAALVLGAAACIWLLFFRSDDGKELSPAPAAPAPPVAAVEVAPPAEPAASPEPVAIEPAVDDSRPIDVPAPVALPASELEIVESAVGSEIVERQLVGESVRFPIGSRVHFWTRVVGGRPGDTIRHVWLHNGWEAGNIELTIGAAHWRTHSVKSLPEGALGQWVVEARDPAGRVLARRSFACVAALE